MLFRSVFCDLDLPWFLRKDAQEGSLPRVDKAEEKSTPKPKEPAKKADSSEN